MNPDRLRVGRAIRGTPPERCGGDPGQVSRERDPSSSDVGERERLHLADVGVMSPVAHVRGRQEGDLADHVGGDPDPAVVGPYGARHRERQIEHLPAYGHAAAEVGVLDEVVHHPRSAVEVGEDRVARHSVLGVDDDGVGHDAGHQRVGELGDHGVHLPR